MDKFVSLVKEMKSLPLAEQEKLIEEKKKVCICPTCPSFNKCAIVEREKLFCLLGKSFLCISFEEGCNCPTCPIAKEAGLNISTSVPVGMRKASDTSSLSGDLHSPSNTDPPYRKYDV